MPNEMVQSQIDDCLKQLIMEYLIEMISEEKMKELNKISKEIDDELYYKEDGVYSLKNRKRGEKT